MWALFSTRLRTWLLVAIAVPVARAVIGPTTRHAAARNPDGTTSRVLTRADATLARWSTHRRERGHH